MLIHQGFVTHQGSNEIKKIVQQIRNFFERKEKLGVDHLDVIGFVHPGTNDRLTIRQRYVFDFVLSIFGKDIVENIQIITTFADGLRPRILEPLREVHFPYKDFFQFNNGGIFYKNISDDENKISECFWKISMNGYEKFFNSLNALETRSLQLTKQVLDQRIQFQTYIEDIFKNKKDKIEEIIQHKLLLDQSIQTINHLVSIAAKRNPALNGDYIQNLIDCEKIESKQGWQQRINHLEDIKQQALLIEKIFNVFF